MDQKGCVASHAKLSSLAGCSFCPSSQIQLIGKVDSTGSVPRDDKGFAPEIQSRLLGNADVQDNDCFRCIVSRSWDCRCPAAGPGFHLAKVLGSGRKRAGQIPACRAPAAPLRPSRLRVCHGSGGERRRNVGQLVRRHWPDCPGRSIPGTGSRQRSCCSC